MYVTAVKCRECKAIIYSRAKHDLRKCECGKIAIDGGQEYVRLVWNTRKMPETFSYEVDATPCKLRDDWKNGTNKYGLIENR